ncbi:MAG: undecaprenyl-diphosphate phosphatase [Acidobacteriota bacterium]
MSSELQAIILGILQGLTEFLPISSSAHLILLPWFMEWEPMGITFDVVIHLGTLLAILIYFRKEWLEVIVETIRWVFRRKTASVEQGRLAGALIVGTFPAVIFGGLGRAVIEHNLRVPMVTAIMLIGFGLLLWRADRAATGERDLSSIRLRDGILIGAAQALALVPGVSRSGVTVTAALLLGLSRPDAARFSFLLAGPIVALGGMASLYDLWRLPAAVNGSGPALLLGVIFSFLSGFLCIKYFLRFLQTRTYAPFVVYRLILALFILSFLAL